MTLEQTLLLHLTCSVAHSCCSMTVLRKLFYFRVEKAWETLQGVLLILPFCQTSLYIKNTAKVKHP